MKFLSSFLLLLKTPEVFFFSAGGGRGANFPFYILSKIVTTFITSAKDLGLLSLLIMPRLTQHFFQHTCTPHCSWRLIERRG